MKKRTKIGIIALGFTLFHLIEDFCWVMLGRFTDLSIPIIISAIVFIGLLGVLFFQIPAVKRFISS